MGFPRELRESWISVEIGEEKGMKRGKEEGEKMGPPMFPRLHVNDADKGGGPRAPPRNKMALYEQLSIPSQRFTSKPLPLNHPNSTSNMVPSVSSNQGSGVERNMAFPRHLPPSTHTHWWEKFHAHHSDVRNGNALEDQLEQRKKVGDKDDFMVPLFVQPRIGQSHQNSLDRESQSSVSSSRSGHQVERQNISNKDPKQDNSVAVNFRREARNERKENMNGQSGNTVISATDQSTREKINGPMKEAKISSNQLLGERDVSNLSRSHDGEACLNLESRTGAGLHGAMQDDDGVGNASWSKSVSRCGEGHVRPTEAENVCNHNSISNRTCTLLQLENTDKGDDLSETSMVDSISDMDISPDDIVGIIGQKHFWKARRAIVKSRN